MNSQVARLVLVGEAVLMFLAGGCGELTALHAATVKRQDLPGEPRAAVDIVRWARSVLTSRRAGIAGHSR